MDRHDIAHYGIAGAIVASLAGGIGYFKTTEPKTWPDLTGLQAANVVLEVVKTHVFPTGGPITVYCMDRDCGKIVIALKKQALASSLTFHSEHPISVPDGVSVGAKTQEDADKLAKAVKTGSDGLLDPEAVPNQPAPYIAFGHFVGEEK